MARLISNYWKDNGGLPERISFPRAIFYLALKTGFCSFEVFFKDENFHSKTFTLKPYSKAFILKLSLVIYGTDIPGKQEHVIFLVRFPIFADIEIPHDLRFFSYFFSLNHLIPPCFTLGFKNLSVFYPAGYLPGLHSSRDKRQLISGLFALQDRGLISIHFN